MNLSPYPVDMSLVLPLGSCKILTDYHPTTVAQYALAHWNAYLATTLEVHRDEFLTQARWLVEHEVRPGDDAGGWPVPFSRPDFHTKSLWLSSSAQGCGISTLVRAYQLTREELFLEVARRAVRTFERDILDGGVSTPVGHKGIFFEEVAVYPAAHLLDGFICGLLGLCDYVALMSNTHIEMLIQRSHTTMHSLLEEFDVGFWTRADLLHRQLASPAQLALQTALLKTLADYVGCEHCSMWAFRWRGYHDRIGTRLRYLVTDRIAHYGRAVLSRAQTMLCGAPRAWSGTPKGRNGAPWGHHTAKYLRVCVPLPAFPVTGGILTVLEGVAQVTRDIWQLEYLTPSIGPQPERYVIHQFGIPRFTPWNFPFVWLYVFTGCRKLLSLMHHGADYDVILPQDGIFTAALSGLAAKLAGRRVVCIDHAHLSLLGSHTYRAERMGDIARKNAPWVLRFLARRLMVLYWPSFTLLARISARLVDHFLVPGVAGDGVEENCKRIGIHESRITRYESMIEVDRHLIPDAALRAKMREEKGLAVNDIIIAIVCRLAPEKGLDIALESISQALSALSPELGSQVRVVIAGDGPLRKHVEESISARGLDQTCLLWGDISGDEVISLLAISDIFLYTSVRGACYAMAILEAMASSCAVVASTKPISNELLLAEGRGIAVPSDDVVQTSAALVRLLNDPELCRQMGRLARDYVALHHSPAMFRRTLLRATYWSDLRIEARLEKSER